MERIHRKALIKNRVALITDLQLDPLVDYLIQEEVLETWEQQKIMRSGVRREQAAFLLDLLPQKDGQAFPVFLSALRKYQSPLAGLLEVWLKKAGKSDTSADETPKRDIARLNKEIAELKKTCSSQDQRCTKLEQEVRSLKQAELERTVQSAAQETKPAQRKIDPYWCPHVGDRVRMLSEEPRFGWKGVKPGSVGTVMEGGLVYDEFHGLIVMVNFPENERWRGLSRDLEPAD